ncbi:hypothetical protein KTR66_00070 [Roseococcus sp. SDR]|uniref:hypothetical protein n=1 Tax=Roseococcus sp. SDR TaxID=2835532 RepID=UPI001BD00383|nr:hypothetical protein [Roseococcus sp. SDR]MBS7788363.1 hypothetical protein [Roseococcus sp. SDR]MBV1843677.1 hypothetical protein [Roseococcus sp. SDR]
MSAWEFWGSVQSAASSEAIESSLPGYLEGPADAYRHIVGAAELRRRFGWAIAYAIVTGNEARGTHARGHTPELRRMDDHNNAIGLSIGADATSYEEVVRRARAANDAGIENTGSGRGQTPLWLSQEQWKEVSGRQPAERALPVEWSDAIPSAADYRFGDERFGADRSFRSGTPRERQAALFERLDATPTAEWSEADVRGVIASPAYRNSAAADHALWRERVRQYFEERASGRDEAASAPDDADDDGIAHVRAYTRMGPNGPIRVSAHDRATPGP